MVTKTESVGHRGFVWNKRSFGQGLKRQRLAADMTLQRLASKSGVSASYLARVERGERHPSAIIVGKIAKSLGMDPVLLMNIAGLLRSVPEDELAAKCSLDPFTAAALSKEPVEIQRLAVSIIAIVKAAARSFKEA